MLSTRTSRMGSYCSCLWTPTSNGIYCTWSWSEGTSPTRDGTSRATPTASAGPTPLGALPSFPQPPPPSFSRGPWKFASGQHLRTRARGGDDGLTLTATPGSIGDMCSFDCGTLDNSDLLVGTKKWVWIQSLPLLWVHALSLSPSLPSHGV
jgi:hypothetical protein